MDNIRETIAKDVSDRLVPMAEETNKEVLDWIQRNIEKQRVLLEQMIDVLTLIYGEDVDQREIQNIVLEQYSSTINILFNEINGELKRSE